MPSNPIPQTVVDKDHELDTRTARAAEALAKHRWRNTLDPSGPRYSFSAYARAVGRSATVITTHAKAYALMVERANDSRPGRELTIEDASRLVVQSAEQQEFSEAIARGAGEPVSRVARGDNATRRGAIIEQARQRAERHGTDPVEEAEEIARRSRQTRDMNTRHRDDRRRRTSIRFTVAEGKLAGAKRQILDAMRELEGVDMTDEEMELMRSTVANLQALLHLLDLRVAGSPDIDWDAELARLSTGGE